MRSLALALSLFVAAALAQLMNGDFTTDLSGWSATSVSHDTDTPTGRTYAQFGGSPATLSQTITGLTPGDRMYFSFDLAGDPPVTDFTLDVQGVQRFKQTGQPTANWATQTSDPFIIPAGGSISITFTGTFPAKKRDLFFGWGLDNVAINPCGACGDPHFTGLHGERYDYNGKAGHSFAIISDSVVQMNSEFIGSKNRNTYLGPTCIRVCKDTARFYPNGTIIINDEVQPDTKFSKRISSVFSVEHRGSSTLVNFGNWSTEINVRHKYFNFGNMRHYATSDINVHGVFGMSGRPDHHQHDKKLCFDPKDGGCQLAGTPADYELADDADLCTTEWTHSQFNPAACDAFSAN